MSAATTRPLDVITFGRCSVDLYGQQIGSRLEDVASFAKSVGGSPTNIAIGAAQLVSLASLLPWGEGQDEVEQVRECFRLALKYPSRGPRH